MDIYRATREAESGLEFAIYALKYGGYSIKEIQKEIAWARTF